MLGPLPRLVPSTLQFLVQAIRMQCAGFTAMALSAADFELTVFRNENCCYLRCFPFKQRDSDDYTVLFSSEYVKLYVGTYIN